MMKEKEYCSYVTEMILRLFKDGCKIKEHVPGKMAAWQVVFQYKSFKIYMNAEKGFLDFHVITRNGKNLGLFRKNPDIFGDHFYTNKNNIDKIVDFLYENRDQIFLEEE